MIVSKGRGIFFTCKHWSVLSWLLEGGSLCRSLKFSLCTTLSFSVLSSVNSNNLGPSGLPTASPHFREAGRLCPCSLSLRHHLETLSGQLTEAIIGLTLFVSCLSGMKVLHWMLSSVLKPLFQYVFPAFECFQQEGNSNPYDSVLNRNESLH